MVYFRLVLILVLISCFSSCHHSTKDESKISIEEEINDPAEYVNFVDTNQFLIGVERLKRDLKAGKTSYVLLDIRKEEAFNEGHIHSAQQVWRDDFNVTKNGLSSFVGSKLQLEKLLSRLGVLASDTLVLYDDRGGVNAARFWFVLSQHGWQKIKILDGGFLRWKKLEYDLELSSEKRASTNFQFASLNGNVNNIYLDELIAKKKDFILLDSRTVDEFTGIKVKKNAAKGGRLPSSKRFDYSELTRVSEGEDGTFREPRIVLEKLSKIGVTSQDSIVVYCHSGARSALLCFYFSHVLNFQMVKNYDGSWIEWSHHPELPFEKG